MTITSTDIESVKNAKKIIDSDLSRHFTITDIGQQVAMGATKLKIIFKQHYGKGLYTYLREERMKKALDLVANTEKTFKEIAKLTGFKYYNNFIAAFTKYHGITPLKARRKAHRH